MKFTSTLFTLAAVLATPILAAPADLSEGVSYIEDDAALLKRGIYSACSGGVAINCGSASISCSGRNCKVCCGNCCKKVTAPANGACNSQTPVIKVTC